MKRYILILFFILSAATLFAAPEPYAHLLIYDQVQKDFFEKFISGQDTTYMVCVEKYTNGEQLKDEIAQKIFLDSFNNWLDKTKYYISQTNREREFEDILNIVNNKENLRQLPCSFSEEGEIKLDADLTVVYKVDATEYCGDAVACFLLGHNALIISVIDGVSTEDYTIFATHELGHAWGLTEQYSGGMADGSFLYNSKVKRPSIMNDNRQVTCDDVDGFITSIDRTLGKEREFHSLCSDGIFIKNGQAVINENETYTLKENYDYFDAEIKVSYDTEFKDAYIIDMTLTNFILNQDGLGLMFDMGFDVPDLKTLEHAQVKIHGSAFEEITDTEDEFYIRTPIGLWTSVLYIKNDSKFEPKQVITKEYFSMEDLPTVTDLDTNSSTLIFNDIAVPLINYLPEQGQGEKEEIRFESFFKHLDFEFNIQNEEMERLQDSL